MCLDVNYMLNNRDTMKDKDINNGNIENSNSQIENSIVRSSGGSLYGTPSVFDRNGEIIYVASEDFIRLFSTVTGEHVRDLKDNKDGKIVGFNLEPVHGKSLIACTQKGTILTWKLDSYMITNKLKLDFPSCIIKGFLVTLINDENHGIINYENQETNQLKISLFELKSGRIIYNYDIPFIQGYKVKIADGNSKYFVAIQKRMAFVIDKFSKTFVAHDNFHGMNVVACHPEDDCFATGDANGKVKLWRNIFSKHAVTQEFHWHHMIVLSLAFSQSGTMLYSGGNEKVLVKWNIADKNFSKNFLPRLPGSLMQISVDSLHDKIALSVDDNSIQIINSNLMIVKVIQEMTQASIYDLGLSQNRYPAGIHLNPRNNQLVLNGRIGHLQFLSSKSLKLLYNMDISMRNSIPRQRETNIFSTEITHVATSFNWLVTVESWNDRVVTPDSRLKFWKFLEDKQTYSLHTQVEQAHMKEITCVEFSSKNDIKNLLCATAGQDKIIKIWSLEKSEDVENAKMIWLCIEQLSYKNLLVKSLNFSNDSSILAGGFGNILCLWNTKNFELKASLSAPAVFDGSINRVLINIPSNKSKNKMKKVDEILEKRKKIVDLMKQMIEDKSNDSLVKNITEEKSRYFKQKQVKKEKLNLLNKAEKKTIFNNILKINELNFNQKIQILHKLNIYYKISNRIESEVFEFMKRGIETDQQCYKRTYQSIIFLKNDDKYKMQWRFRTWNNLISKRNRKFVSVRNLLTKKVFVNNIEKFKEQKEGENFLPIKNLTQITNVFFCSDELSHLVVITTPKKLLVWNLLTLKLHGSFNIQVKFATIDPITNLLAIFTKFHELFIFSLWPYLVLHRQKNMPEIYGAIWIPREFPTSKSLNVNWQASSQLLFLNHNQELCRIRTPEDDDFKSTTPYLETTNEPTSNTPFAAMIAKKINDETTKDVNGFSKRVAVSGTGAVKDIVNLSSHAMPPMRMLSKDFIGSFLATNKHIQSKSTRENSQIIDSMEISDDETENSPENMKILRLKAIENEEKSIREISAKKKELDVVIQRKFKSLKLNTVENFEL